MSYLFIHHIVQKQPTAPSCGNPRIPHTPHPSYYWWQQVTYWGGVPGRYSAKFWVGLCGSWARTLISLNNWSNIQFQVKTIPLKASFKWKAAQGPLNIQFGAKTYSLGLKYTLEYTKITLCGRDSFTTLNTCRECPLPHTGVGHQWYLRRVWPTWSPERTFRAQPAGP